MKAYVPEDLSLPPDSLGLLSPLLVSCILCPISHCAKPSKRTSLQEQGKEGWYGCNLGGSCGDFALTRHWLISLACVANNIFHLWLTNIFNGGTIIPEDALQFLPPGVGNILQLVKQNTAAIFVREPLPPEKDCINILQNDLWQHHNFSFIHFQGHNCWLVP